MSKNEKLPEFDTNLLSEFTFGDPEAKSDEMLMHCFQKVRGVQEFLSGSKSIVLGERGAGKSALFRLVANGTLTFGKDNKRNTIVIPIDEDLEYLAIANIVEERFSDQTKRKHGKYRYLWELYILSRIIDRLHEGNPDDLEVITLRDDFGAVLGLPKKEGFRLRDLFTAYKVTVGGKIDQFGSVTPSISVEPAKDATATKHAVTDHEIAGLRERLKKLLRSKATVAIVLVDRVDDFVVGDSYEEQLKNIQALVDCIKDFRLPEMKLKIFLRTDLFRRISFAHGGYDKLSPQIVQLEWTSKDICEFIARRLIHNYVKLDIHIPYNIDLSLLDIDPSFADQLRELFNQKPNGLRDALKGIFYVAVLKAKIRWAKLKRKSHSARHTDLVHALIVRIITHIFPRKVVHYSSQCRKEEIPFENYLASHFKLGAETPNPRLVLLFLSFTFEDAAYYYSRNPDKSIIFANDEHEYELILKENIVSGYEKLQDIVKKTIAHLSPQHQKYIERLYLSLKNPDESSQLALDDLHRLTEWDKTEEDFHNFIKLFTHIGLLVADNPGMQFEKRTFSLPLVMKTCPA